MKKPYQIKIKLNEDVTIPPDLSNQYLNVKTQIANKQSKKDQLMKQANQMDNEINILTKNLIAIETKAAQLQGQEVQQTQQSSNVQSVAAQPSNQSTTGVQENVKESLDYDWKKFLTEDSEEDSEEINSESRGNYFDELEDTSSFNPDDESLEGDYAFSLIIKDRDEEEDIIAKFYKDEDGDFWKVRVVQGSEEPLETMQFDPEMEMLDIIEHLATMFDEVEEIDTSDYEDLLDDKEESDKIFYDDILTSE